MRKLIILLFIVLFSLGFLVRLYRFDNPVADWHSWRQSDTAAVSKMFVMQGFDVFHPKYFDISKIQSGKENPNGYRFVEFPIFNIFQAGLFNLFGFLTIDQWGRMVAIVSSLLSGLFVFLIVKKYANRVSALFSSFFFLFLPFSIFYSRTILPDQMMVMATLGGIYFFSLWTEKKLSIFNFQFLITLLFTASAFLLKPYAFFFVLPFVYIAWKKFGFGFLKKWQLWLFLILSIVPFVLWRLWMLQFPEGIPYSEWLFNQGNIRFKGAFFYWIFGERISKLILGYFGVGIIMFGFLKKNLEKNYLFFLSFLVSSLLYLTVFARGNVQHDYYQILIIPTISIFLGRGADFLLSFKDKAQKIGGIVIVTASIALMLPLSWYYIRDFFNINNREMVEAGKLADKLIPKNAKVIAPYQGDTTFLYQIGRQGWPLVYLPINEMIAMGAEYIVIEHPTKADFEGYGEDYKVLAGSEKYLILKVKWD